MRQRQDENRIYEIALAQFARYGYKKATLEDIAAELHMTGASLYSYASSKLGLYHDSVGYALKKWQTYVLESVEGIDDTEEYFLTLGKSAVAYLGQDETLRTILRRDPNIFPVFPEVDPYEEINGESLALLKSVLDKGISEGVFVPVDTAECAKLLFALYKNVIVDAYIQEASEDILKGVPNLLKLLLHGMKTRN